MPDYFPYIEGLEIEWLELNLLKTGRSMSKSTVMSLLTDPDENQVDSWFTELMDRNFDLSTPYYTQTGNTIKPEFGWSDVPEYFLCLYFSYAGAYNDHVGTRLFERISGIAMKNFIGGEIFSLGFPSGKNLNQELDELAPLCYEDRGRPAHPDYKDDGVDIICYKNFGDNKSSNLYVLLQCAAGINWKSKNMINMDNWVQYIFWVSKNIVTSLSTTEYVKDRQWEKSSSRYGLLMDRNRVLNWYNKSIDASLRKEVQVWCVDKGI